MKVFIKGLLKRRDLKTFIINPKFQLDFIVRILILGVINFGVFYGAFRYHFETFYAAGKEMKMDPNSYYFRFLEQQLQGFNSTFFWLSFVSFMITLVGGLILSHRVAGPLYRLRQHMNHLAKGGEDRAVKFRNKDYFHELADGFNEQHKARKNKAS